MAYPSFEVTNTFANGNLADATEVNANFTDIETAVDGCSAVGVPAAIGITPVGCIVAWHKTFHEVSSTGGQTNTTQSATQLIDSAADFVSDGVTAGMIVHNEDDNEFAIVETVVDLNTLTLVNDVNADTTNIDTFNSGVGVNYAVYGTPELPDNWLECNGQTISDADSPYNGATLPNLHTAVEDVNGYFLRGVIEGADTGTTEGSANLAHTHQIAGDSTPTDGVWGSTQTSSGASDHGYTGAQSSGGNESRPVAFAIVWIMRVK